MRPLTIQATGDLYFTRQLMDFWERDRRYRLLREPWTGGKPVQPLSQRERESADIIFCDWCGEYADYYARHKKRHQKLIVRMIMYDTVSQTARKVPWDSVDQIVFIIPDLDTRFRRHNEAVTTPRRVIRLAVDTASFDLQKSESARFTLGMLGFYEQRKGPDLAVRILEALCATDQRYRLSFKGQHPWQRGFVWRRQSSRNYTDRLYRAIMRSPAVEAIEFNRHDRQVPEWFTGVGIILSASTDESCHLAVAEGMASAAAPVVRAWPDADWQYPAHFVLPLDETAFVDAAVERILSWQDLARYRAAIDEAQAWARSRFDVAVIAAQYDALFDELLGGRPATETPE